ncbi:hypothetical protein B5M09_008082 [Aphanomyces astaci]|uniref:tRNA (guanine(9)-N(1))-methyltransferase n=1 Tax=Aphanomyces astaci TaxID=112090 RepID=A0A3R7Y4L2_APHAT|nr:hypothetical protein B5M09_008082 [Aphanomyces astaci]
MQAKAERQHRWEIEAALHPIDQEEKQRLYDAKMVVKKQQQAQLEERLNMAMAIGLRVVVDLDFLNVQTIRRNSVFKQIATIYGTMKKSSFSNLLSLHLASYGGDVATFCDQKGAQSWKVTRHDQPVHDLFQNDNVVFLSPDAPTALTAVDPDTVYVVGGIVDRTVRKSQSLAKAHGSAIRTARLPVQEHLRVKSHVLNIDTVVLALLEVHNHGDWKRAFESVLPKRLLRPDESQ